MTRETFMDRWTPETPVKVTWGGDDPDAYLSLEDAAKRLSRFRLSDSPEKVRAGLESGIAYHTPFARYEMVAEATA